MEDVLAPMHITIFQLNECIQEDKLNTLFVHIIPQPHEGHTRDDGVPPLATQHRKPDKRKELPKKGKGKRRLPVKDSHSSGDVATSSRDVATSSHHITNPLLVLINAFFQNATTVSPTHEILQHVRYSDDPVGVLLIIKSSSHHAYLCESGTGSNSGPLHLPMGALDTDGRLDLTLLQDGDFLQCLKNFMTEQMQSLKCIACVSRMANIMFRACRHLALCVACSHLVSKCPLCRAPISNDGRLLLPEHLRTSDVIDEDDVKTLMDQLQVVRDDPGWILSKEQLQDILQQSQSQRVLSTTAKHVAQNLEDRMFTDQLQLEHVVDFITDVVVHGVEMLKIIRTPTYEAIKTHVADLDVPDPYQQGPSDQDADLVKERMQHQVRIDIANRGYFTNAPC